MGQRRKSRELALQVLFQQEFSPQTSLQASLETFRQNFSFSKDIWQYASQIISGIEQHRSEIDAAIARISAHWTLPRMALTDLNVMRVAAYELLFSPEQLPPSVVIDEAVEIARKYGGSDSAAFVNGVLDKLKRPR